MILHLTRENLSLARDAAFEFFEESQLPGSLKFDYWKDRWSEIFEYKLGTIIAYMSDDIVKGIMGALIYPCWMTSDIEGLEAFWFVRKPYRGTPIGIKMLKEYERWAKDKGAVRVKMVHLECINADLLEKVYLRMGYEKLERSYSKELYERSKDRNP